MEMGLEMGGDGIYRWREEGEQGVLRGSAQ